MSLQKEIEQKFEATADAIEARLTDLGVDNVEDDRLIFALMIVVARQLHRRRALKRWSRQFWTIDDCTDVIEDALDHLGE